VPPGLAAYIVMMGQTLTRQARRRRRAHPGHPLWGKFWEKVEDKLPWLAPSLTAKTQVREWTLGVEVGIPSFVKGRLDVTFDDGGDGWDPGGDDTGGS